MSSLIANLEYTPIQQGLRGNITLCKVVLEIITMGCSQSIPENHPTIFQAKNIDDDDKNKNDVFLEVKTSNLVVYSRSRKIMAKWPVQCLQRYGFNDDLLLVETGHGCDTGQGLFLFKCRRATQLFDKIKEEWTDIQNNTERSYPHLAYPPQMSSMTETTALPSTSYYNTNSSGPPLTAGLSSISGHPSGSRYTPPTPGTRGSASSHNTGISGSQRSLSTTFELQPAPVGRQEMLSRRRFHSNAIGYNRRTETVTINHPRHHTVSGEHDYENREIITKHKTPQIKSEVVAFNTASGSVSFRGHSPNTPQRGASATSLRSDGEHVPLTPISSSTSGIGSLNGNITSDTKSNGAIPQSSVGASSSQAPPPIPAADPWRRQSGWLKHRKTHTRKLRHEFLRLSPGLPLSARDYVNTANASLDVSGTPLPATAIVSGGNHFSFDFVPRYLSSHSASHHNHNINYVPIEVSTKNGDFYSCGASSASSGLPGTPLTPRTPGGHNFSCEYAEIDHHKTRALSNAFRSRQKEMKTRHASCETAALINGNT